MEKSAQVHLGREEDAHDGVWYLDTGATNHMSGDHAVFTDLDTGVVGSVKFGDGSNIHICSQGIVLFTCKTGEHRAITEVYSIPRLRMHIIILGQLDENGCQVLIQQGVLHIRDRQRQLLAKVQRAADRLYTLTLRVA